jgi:hypothetical protein
MWMLKMAQVPETDTLETHQAIRFSSQTKQCFVRCYTPTSMRAYIDFLFEILNVSQVDNLWFCASTGNTTVCEKMPL